VEVSLLFAFILALVDFVMRLLFASLLFMSMLALERFKCS
jgi:hypothetical protein